MRYQTTASISKQWRVHAITACIMVALAPHTALAASIQPSERYQQCSSLVQRDPQLAQQHAMDWYSESPNPAAQHCRALALYSLKKFAAAGVLLDDILPQIQADETILKGNVYLQTAHAWKQAGDTLKAEARLGDAVAILSQIDTAQVTLISILQERAKLYAEQGKQLEAIQDLDHILSLKDDYTPALLMRARQFNASGKDTLAQEDYRRVLELDENNVEAKTALGKF